MKLDKPLLRMSEDPSVAQCNERVMHVYWLPFCYACLHWQLHEIDRMQWSRTRHVGIKVVCLQKRINGMVWRQVYKNSLRRLLARKTAEAREKLVLSAVLLLPAKAELFFRLGHLIASAQLNQYSSLSIP